MIFLYETKNEGIISVEANIINGELDVKLNVKVGKREAQDILEVARTALAYEGFVEDDVYSLRRFK